MAKHLTLEDRNLIAQRLNEGCSFKAIAKELDKNCTSISREVRNHLVFRKTGTTGKYFNACKHRIGCKKFRICPECSHKGYRSLCQKLLAPPYVCNGCPRRNTTCTLEKRYYKPLEAWKEYRDVLSESRSGIPFRKKRFPSWMKLFLRFSGKNNPFTISVSIMRIPLWSVKVRYTDSWIITSSQQEILICQEKYVMQSEKRKKISK